MTTNHGFVERYLNSGVAGDFVSKSVMTSFMCRTLEEVVKRANNTRYGLAAGVVTKNIDVANTLSRSVRAGIIWINCYNVMDTVLPFGGYKMSGIGREQGIHAILNFMQLKSVVTPLHDSPWL